MATQLSTSSSNNGSLGISFHRDGISFHRDGIVFQHDGIVFQHDGINWGINW
jgi:hypothetical protein